MRTVLLSGAAMLGLVLAGCQTLAVPGGRELVAAGFSYQGGTAVQAFAFSPTQVQSAALEAMADLKMSSVRQTPTASGTTLNGLTADGRRVMVAVNRASTTDSNGVKLAETEPIVTVRVGWLGDEPLSRAVMDRIGTRLGSLPPSAIPSEPPSEPEKPAFFGVREVNPPSVRRLNDAGYRDTPVP
jgi:hypothetical protein